MANTLIAGCHSSFAEPTSVTTLVCFIFRRRETASSRRTISRPSSRSRSTIPSSRTSSDASIIPKVLQDVDLERTMIHAISAGLGVALVPEQLKKLPHKNVLFRPVMPAVATEACVAWKGENPSDPLKAYVEIVERVGRSIR